jgi:hypothetical protein
MKKSKAVPESVFNTIVDELELTPPIERLIRDVVSQLMTVRELTTSDMRQCRDLVELELRTNETKEMASIARMQGDLAAWGRALKMLDGYAGMRRGLLRDLKLTRITTMQPTTTSTERKHDQKAASEWSGIL